MIFGKLQFEHVIDKINCNHSYEEFSWKITFFADLSQSTHTVFKRKICEKLHLLFDVKVGLY